MHLATLLCWPVRTLCWLERAFGLRLSSFSPHVLMYRLHSILFAGSIARRSVLSVRWERPTSHLLTWFRRGVTTGKENSSVQKSVNEVSWTLMKSGGGGGDPSADWVGAGLFNVWALMLIGLQINTPRFHVPNVVFVCALWRLNVDKISYISSSPV